MVQLHLFGIEPFLYNRQTQKKICVNLWDLKISHLRDCYFALLIRLITE